LPRRRADQVAGLQVEHQVGGLGHRHAGGRADHDGGYDGRGGVAQAAGNEIRMVTAIRVMPDSGDQLVRPMALGQDHAGDPDPQRADQRHHQAAAEAHLVGRQHGHHGQQHGGAGDGRTAI
jgi:hypothetical protein